MIRSDMQLAEKASYFRRMIHQDFDLTGICRFVLDPYWRGASPDEGMLFRSLFADRLVHFYGRQLAESGGGDFVVTGSRTGANGLRRVEPYLSLGLPHADHAATASKAFLGGINVIWS